MHPKGAAQPSAHPLPSAISSMKGTAVASASNDRLKSTSAAASVDEAGKHAGEMEDEVKGVFPQPGGDTSPSEPDIVEKDIPGSALLSAEPALPYEDGENAAEPPTASALGPKEDLAREGSIRVLPRTRTRRSHQSFAIHEGGSALNVPASASEDAFVSTGKSRWQRQAAPLFFLYAGISSLLVVSGGMDALIYHFVLRHGKQTTFDPADARLGFQSSAASGPDSRGTMDIVLSCAATMLICVVTAVHFDVPLSPRDLKDMDAVFAILKTRVLPVPRRWKIGCKCAVWSIGLLFPEYLVLWALLQLERAHSDVTFMRRMRCPEWTHKHAFFALMGGLKRTDGRLIVSGKELYDMDTSENKSAIKSVDYQALLEDIDDKSKADTVGKLLAVFQITRFLAGTIARAVQHLPISPLEYITCSYVVCALILYGVWFHKPYDVKRALRVDLGHLYDVDAGADRAKASPIPASATTLGFSKTSLALVAPPGILTMLLIGAGHLASWDVRFLNTSGRLLWRVAGIYITALPVLCALLPFIAPLVIIGAIHMKIFLMFLTVYSFYSLPAGVYDTKDIDWLQYIPFLH